MDMLEQVSTRRPALAWAVGREDIFWQNHNLGVIQIDYNVCKRETSGLFVMENVFHNRGGPARHLHLYQDEWFYVIEGEFIFEIGEDCYRLKAGDSLLAPHRVPHVWAYTGSGSQGKILIAVNPAGKMEEFFRLLNQKQAAPQDPAVWRKHGMELLGPPLAG